MLARQLIELLEGFYLLKRKKKLYTRSQLSTRPSQRRGLGALAFLLLAIAMWTQCACNWGTDECSSDDEAPEGMFS